MPRIYDRRLFTRGSASSSPVFDIPVGVTKVRLRCSRDSWPDRPGSDPREQEVVRAQIEFSMDGGSTWPFGIGFGAAGGDYFTRTGALAPYSAVAKTLPEPNNPNRRLRVSIEARSAFTSQVDVDLT